MPLASGGRCAWELFYCRPLIVAALCFRGWRGRGGAREEGMVGDVAKFFALTVLLALCVLTADAGPCFSRTGEPAPVIVVAAGPGRHVLKAGETINLLAYRFGVTPAAILKANPGLDPARLPVGREILIPAGTRAASEPAAPAAAPPIAPAGQGIELRPEKAPQATPPLRSHDLSDAPAKAGAPQAIAPEPPAGPGQAAVPERKTGLGPAPADVPQASGEPPAPGVAVTALDAVKDHAPPPPASPVAGEHAGEHSRRAFGSANSFADQLGPWIFSLSSRLLAALALFAAGIWVSNRLGALLERLLNARQVPPEVVAFARSLCRYGLYLVVGIASLGQLGLNVGALLVLFGAIGLAVSLALKDTLSSFASGILLLLFRLFRVGDRVSVPGVAGAAGVVTTIDICNTVVRSDAGDDIIIPNARIVGNIIVVSRRDAPEKE